MTHYRLITFLSPLIFAIVEYRELRCQLDRLWHFSTCLLRRTNSLWILYCNDATGKAFLVIFQHLLALTERNVKNVCQGTELVPRFEPWVSRIRSSRANQSAESLSFSISSA